MIFLCKRVMSMSLVLTMVLSCVLFAVPVLATETTYGTEPYFSVDFDSFAVGVTDISSLGLFSSNGTTVVKENGDKCLLVAPDAGGAAGVMIKEYFSIDANKPSLVASVRFKIKDASTKGVVLGVTGAHGTYHKCYVRIEGQNLYRSDSSSSNTNATLLYEGIELNKWYTIYTSINTYGPNRSIHLGDKSVFAGQYSYVTGNGENYNAVNEYRRRFICQADAGAIYIDNINCYEIKQADVENEFVRLKVNSIKDTEVLVGYENGQYPPGAVDMAIDICASSNENAVLSQAMTELENRKVNTSSTDASCAFVQINTADSVNVNPGEATSVTLDATAKTVGLQDAGDSVTWSLVDAGNTGVSLNGNVLTIPSMETGGTVKLKASAGNVYTYLNLKIHVVQLLTNVTIQNFDDLTAIPLSFSSGEVKGDPAYPGRSLYTTLTTNTLSTAMTTGVISYDFYIPSLPSGASQCIMGLSNVLNIYAGEDGLLYYGSDENKTAFTTYPKGKWFTVSLAFDGKSQKATVYMNGVQLAYEVDFVGAATTVDSASTTCTGGIYIDNVYTAMAESLADADAAMAKHFAKNFRYVESMDRKADTNGDTIIDENDIGDVTNTSISGKAFATELARAGAQYGTDSRGEYRTYNLCQITDAEGVTSKIWVVDYQMASTIEQYGEENVIVLESKTAIRFTTGSAIKLLAKPLDSGVVKFSFDAYVPAKADASFLTLKNGDTSVLTFKLTADGNGETGTLKATLNDVWCGIYGPTGWNNISILVDFNNDTAELFINGVPGNSVELTDIVVDAVDIAGVVNVTYFDNLCIEGFGSMSEARTAVYIDNLEDDILFSKVANFLQTKRNIVSDNTVLASAHTQAQAFLKPNNFLKDKFGEVEGVWEETFDSSSTLEIVSGHAKILRDGNCRYLKNVSNEAGGDLASGIWTTEFDFMMEEKANVGVITQIYNKTGKRKVCSLRVNNGSIQAVDSALHTLLETFTEGRWYTMSIRVDVDKETVDYYVDDSLILANQPFAQGGEVIVNGSNIAKDTNRMFDTFTGSEGSEYWLDNIRVYQDAVAPALAVSSPVFTDTAGNITWKPLSGGKLQSVYVRNENNTAANLYAGVYVGNQLKAISCVKNVAEGINVLDLALPVTAEKMTIKFFVLQDETIIPITTPTPYQKEKINLFVLSDSIYDGASGASGVGDKLQDYLSAARVTVYNRARAGHTLANIASLGYLDSVLDMIEPGDYVLISFAHNDGKPGNVETFAPVEMDMQAPYTHETYQARLVRYAQAIRLRGGNPIFATSLARYRTSSNQIGKDHGNYIQAMINVANEIKVPLIDLNQYSTQLLIDDNSGAASRYLYNTVTPTDTTHVSEEGASFFAKWLVGQMKTLGLSIGEYAIGLE